MGLDGTTPTAAAEPKREKSDLHVRTAFLSRFTSNNKSAIAGHNHDDGDMYVEDDFDWFHADPTPDAVEEEPKAQGIFARCGNFPIWARFIVLTAIGLSVCAIPLLIAQLVIKEPGDPLLMQTINSSDDLKPSTEITRWSLWLGSSWLAWVFFWYFIDDLPELVVAILHRVGSSFTELTRARLEYVVAVRGSLTVACWAIITVIAYGSLFNQMRKVDYWTDIFHVIVTAMVFCILYLVQKLLLQMIAVKFHRVAYKDRIVQSKKGMKIVEALRKAVKNRGLFVPAELNLMRSRLLKRPKSFPDATALATQGDSLYHDSHAPEATGGRKAAPFWRSVGRRKAPRGEITRSLEALNLGVSSMGNASDVHLHEDVLKSASLVPKPDDVTASQPIYLAQPESATEALPPEMPIPELVRQPSIERQPPLNLGADGEGQGASSPAARSRRTSTNRKGLDAETASLGAKSTRSMHLPRLATMLRRTSKVGAAEAVAEEPPVVETPAPPPVIRPAVLLRDLRGSKYIKQFARMDATGHVQAGKLARKIFGALGGYEQEALQPKDFEPCFSDPQDAVEAFALMDQDGNGSVTKKELKESIVGIYREHRRLARAMRDLSHVIGKLDIFFTCITCFITFCVALPVFGISLTAMLPFTSFILALSFVFGTAARTAFECLLFLFVTHPYDAGDRVFIDNQSLFVEEVGVLTTVFRRLDGQLIYAPNPLLQSKLIHNIRRSRDQSEAIEIQVIFDTPEDKLKTLHQKMIEYVKSEPREFQPVCDMHILDIENQNKVKLSFILKHKGNWQDGSKRWNRRTMFMYALKRELVALDIKYMMPPPYKAPDPVPPVGEANAQTTASTVPTIVLTGSQVIPQPLAGAANMTAGVP